MRTATLAGLMMMVAGCCSTEPDEVAPGGDLGLVIPGEDDERSFVAVVPTETSEDQQLARRMVGDQVADRLLRGWVARPGDRDAIGERVIAILRREKMRVRDDGKVRFSCKVSMSEARGIQLEVLGADRLFGRDAVVIAICDRRWVQGADLDEREVEIVRRSVMLGCSDTLSAYRFRGAGGDEERVLQAAISLGTDPAVSRLRDFADMFQAPLVVAIQGRIKLEPYPSDSPHAAHYRGYLRCQGVTARVYDRNSGTILAQVALDPDADDRLKPSVGHGDSLSEKTETFGRLVGRTLAANLVRRLYTAMR